MIARTWFLVVTATLCAMNICIIVESAYEADEILHLPGQPRVDFRQFAGYINIHKEQQRSLFYYFVEAETDPASKPLVLWLGGGQCSSIAIGAFGAHGPFRPSGDKLVKNNHSWNREANILYLDYPAGIGFSRSVNESFTASANVEIIAQDNLVFLESWFHKFTEYKDREFFIAGSYLAGYFVPQLAQLIVQSNMRCNLKGVALGHPLLDVVFEMNSRAEFLWSHGMISDAMFEMFTNVCNISQLYFYNSDTPACSRVRNLDNISWPSFGILSDVCLSSGAKAKPQYTRGGRDKIDVCLIDEIVQYMSRKDVQNAFHPQLGVSNWRLCDYHINPVRGDEENPRTVDVGLLVRTGIRTMVYSGDQDALVPLTATRKLVDKLAKDMKMNTTVSYRAWFEGGQVGGWTQVYDDMLTFSTIRGSSSNPALTQPERSLILFRSFLSGKPLPDSTTRST